MLYWFINYYHNKRIVNPSRNHILLGILYLWIAFDDTRYTNIEGIRSATSAFTLFRSRGYKIGRHYHIEVHGEITNDITSNAKNYSFLTFTGVPQYSVNVSIGSVFLRGILYSCYAILRTDGYIYQDTTDAINKSDQVGFILDFYYW